MLPGARMKPAHLVAMGLEDSAETRPGSLRVPVTAHRGVVPRQGAGPAGQNQATDRRHHPKRSRREDLAAFPTSHHLPDDPAGHCVSGGVTQDGRVQRRPDDLAVVGLGAQFLDGAAAAGGDPDQSRRSRKSIRSRLESAAFSYIGR
jgi:hypothetical protein